MQNNRLFHSMLFRCAHNKFLVKTINKLKVRHFHTKSFISIIK
ncbi:hypothetical protein [Campylobacter fetus]